MLYFPVICFHCYLLVMILDGVYWRLGLPMPIFPGVVYAEANILLSLSKNRLLLDMKILPLHLFNLKK